MYTRPTAIGRFPLADSRRLTQSVDKYQTCLIRRVGRLYRESADDYGESADAYIPTRVMYTRPTGIGRFPLADSRRLTQSVDKYQTCLIRRVGQLYRESADDYGESADAYIPIGVSALEPADSELESADSSAASSTDSAKVGLWVWALSLITRDIPRLVHAVLIL